MKSYVLTVFEKSGKKLLDETFTASNDEEAKRVGTARLTEEGYNDHNYRCASSDARLVLFQS